MKKLAAILILTISVWVVSAGGVQTLDSHLDILDRTIEVKNKFSCLREAGIDSLKSERLKAKSPDQLYAINDQIILAYQSFVHDSTEYYIAQNLALATRMNDMERLWETKIRQALLYSLSGLFVQADQIFTSIDYDTLPTNIKIAYCWNIIIYYENISTYTDDARFDIQYAALIYQWRDRVMALLPEGSEEWRKERAFTLQSEGDYPGALVILTDIFNHQQPGTHAYAMAAMSLAKVYKLAGDRNLENQFLIIAAIADLQFAVKENEALLTLAMNIFEADDVLRAYNYVRVTLSDANFYGSRFRNTVIARVQPVIESNYWSLINRQRTKLIMFMVMLSLVGVGLVIALLVVFRQMHIVSKARRHLRKMNSELVALNHRLTEANTVKEKYIGYFMRCCMTYIDKLDTYRKEVNRKIKSGQADRLYKPSDGELRREIEQLYENFDEAFLMLYPDFVERFNSLLQPGEEYNLDRGRLNTELRVFALMRLGITNINQIAEFLHCSQQTIYNYRSKFRSRVHSQTANLEEEVQRLSHFKP